MAEQNITTKFEIDVSQLKYGIQEANRNIKLATAEFKAVSSAMDNWEESTEGVSAKLKELQAIEESQKSKLAQLKQEYNELTEVEGDNTIALQKKLIQIRNQESVVNKTTKEIKKYESSLREVAEAEALAEKEGISVDEAFRKLKKSAEDVEEAVEDTSDGFTTMKGVLAGLVVEGIKSFISGVTNAIAESKEFRNELAMLEATANTTGTGFDKASKTLKEIAKITGDTGAGVEAVNNMMSAGFKGENLDKLTDQLLGASIKWKDTLKMEGLADGLQETLATGGATGAFGELLERSGKNLDTFNAGLAKCTTEAEKQNYVLKELASTGLTDVLDEYRENNKYMLMNEEASYSLQESMAKFATKVEPIVASVKSGVADLLSTFLSMGDNVNLEGVAEKITSGMKLIKGVLTGKISPGELMTIASEWITKLGDGIAQNVPSLISKGLDMLVNLTTSLRANAPKLIQSGLTFIQNLVQGIMNALPDLIAKVPIIVSNLANVINDNAPTVLKAGFNIIVTIIKGIIQAIPTLIANVPKIISAIVDVWSAFNWLNLGKSAITKMGDGIKSLAGSMKTIGGNVKDWIVNAVKNLPTTLSNLGKDAITKMGSAISGAKSTITNGIKKIFNAVYDGVKGLPEKLKSVGKDLVKGLWEGISNMTGWVIDKIEGFGSSVLDGIKDFFDIHSPSRETAWIGEMLAEGMGKGFTSNMASVVKDMKGSLSPVIGNLQSSVSGSGESVSQGGIGGSTYNFYQTNNSPKALSRLDIYRQSKNLLSGAVGV